MKNQIPRIDTQPFTERGRPRDDKGGFLNGPAIKKNASGQASYGIRNVTIASLTAHPTKKQTENGFGPKEVKTKEGTVVL